MAEYIKLKFIIFDSFGMKWEYEFISYLYHRKALVIIVVAAEKHIYPFQITVKDW